MRLDRNITTPRRGKYALIKLRQSHLEPTVVAAALAAGRPAEVEAHAIDFGDTAESDFFVIRLRDKNAANALMAYAVSCRVDDPEFANEVHLLSLKAAAMQNKQFPT